MLRTDDLDYHLPDELIATEPAAPRDSARLLVLFRGDPDRVEHRHVHDLPEYLSSGDLMVVNRTRVLPARFRGVRTDTGGKGEGLFIEEQSAAGAGPMVWRVLLKLRRTRPGAELRLLDAAGRPSPVSLRLLERAGMSGDEESAGWTVAVEGAAAGETTRQILDRVGLTPLPPYILAARRRHEAAATSDDAHDREVYQTVYASSEAGGPNGRGSVAAPTAGLHFTPGLLERLASRGVARAEVVLDVGMGTFKPVECEFVEDHPMHAEWCAVPAETARALADRGGSIGATGAGRKVIAVGTTTARTLESFASPADMLAEPSRQTRILITPGHRFRHINALMTNFHLPRSTLLAMVAAFIDDDDRVRGQGLARLLAAYRMAVDQGYRFYSFGDAMLILP